MSAFDLRASLRRGEKKTRTARARRSDRGRSRLPAPVQARLAELLSGPERPPMRQVLDSLAGWCRREGYPMPARATVYAFVAHAPVPRYPVAELPPCVRETLHNLDPHAAVPGPQLVQRAFNAGSVEAVCFASSLPWLCLYQASRLRGWRPKSHALLRAVSRFRRIERTAD